MTNYEKYFGSPKKVVSVRVIEYDDPPNRISVIYRNKCVVDLLPKHKFSDWLQEECE